MTTLLPVITGDLTIASRHERHVIRLDRLTAHLLRLIEAKGYSARATVRYSRGDDYDFFPYIEYWIGERNSAKIENLFLPFDLREPDTSDEDFLSAAAEVVAKTSNLPTTREASLAEIIRMSEKMREIGEEAGLSAIFLNPIAEFAESIRHNILEDKRWRGEPSANLNETPN